MMSFHIGPLVLIYISFSHVNAIFCHFFISFIIGLHRKSM